MVTKFHGFRSTSEKELLFIIILSANIILLFSLNSELEVPTGDIVDVIYAPNPVNSCNSCLRAAGAVFNKDGHLIVSGDTTNELFRVAYNTELPVISNVYY